MNPAESPALPQPAFPADAFRGTADYYARYRVPYPRALWQDLLARARVTRSGRLLDLACGPGCVALVLAPSFREVWAVDLEPEMIEAGKAEAARRGVTNVQWFAGRAEELAAPVAAFELVTIGSAFHRLDQPLIAARVRRWLQPGGGLATIGTYGITGGSEPWQRVVAEVVRKWTERGMPAAAAAPPPETGPEHDERVLRAAGYADVASHPFIEPREWTIETITGYLYSTSFCSRRALGGRAEAFAAELAAALRAHAAGGRYRENTRSGYTFARNPG